MHELSIAQALRRLVTQHTPSGAKVLRVHVQAGPLRAIEPQAMQWAWKAVTMDSNHEPPALELECLPWRLSCPGCGRWWTSQNPLEPCPCGCGEIHPTGGNELTLVSIEVEPSEDCPDDPRAVPEPTTSSSVTADPVKSKA